MSHRGSLLGEYPDPGPHDYVVSNPACCTAAVLRLILLLLEQKVTLAVKQPYAYDCLLLDDSILMHSEK